MSETPSPHPHPPATSQMGSSLKRQQTCLDQNIFFEYRQTQHTRRTAHSARDTAAVATGPPAAALLASCCSCELLPPLVKLLLRHLLKLLKLLLRQLLPLLLLLLLLLNAGRTLYLGTAEDVGIQLSSPGSNGRMSERGCKSASLQQSRQADG